ncbi:MAG: LPS export ABC transporter periplasmic protein LptC [Gemmatimonadales bacterium]
MTEAPSQLRHRRWATLLWQGGVGVGFVALLGCNDQGTRPSAGVVTADSADQVIYQMTTRGYENGDRKSHVTADTAFVFQGAQKMDLRHLRVVFFDEAGKQSSVLTARTGIYNLTNGSLDARGSVFVESADGRKLTTEHLIYDKSMLQLRSDTAFVYNSRTEQLRGTGFTSDLEFRNVKVDKPTGFQRGAGVTIPGQ